MPGTVLIIEDDRLHRQVYSAAVQAHGFEAIGIADEREAVTAACLSVVHAIIIDIRLPHIDGRTLIALLRREEKTRAIPIVAVSAYPEFGIAEACLTAGADRFHQKPVRLRTLIEDILGLMKEGRA